MSKRLPPNTDRQFSGKDKPKRMAYLVRYLPQVILILACFTQFLPLVVFNDSYYPYVFPKSVLFRGIVEAMVFVYVLLATISPAYRPRFHRVIYAFLAYFGIMLISSLPPNSISPWTSWWGDFSRMGGMISQLHLMVFFFVLSQTLKRAREWTALFATALYSGVLMGLTGLAQYVGLDYLYDGLTVGRIRGAAGNSDFFALLMALDFFLVLWFLSRKEKTETYALTAKIWLALLVASDLFLLARGSTGPANLLGSNVVPVVVCAIVINGITLLWFATRRRVAAGAAVLSLSGLYYLYWMLLSQTRFAVIGVIGSLVFVSVIYLLAGGSRRMKWVTAGLLLCVCLLPSYVWLNRRSSWVQGNPALNRLTSISYAYTAPRLLAWRASVLSILDRPLLGWGPENYQNAFDFHFPAKLLATADPETWFDRAHNILLDVGTSTGLLGLAAYLAFYGLLFVYLLRRWRRTREAADSLVLAGFFAAYLLQDFFIFDTINTDVIVFAVLAYAAFLIRSDESGEPETEKTRHAPAPLGRKGWVAITIGSVFLVSAGWYTVKRPYDSNRMLDQGIALEKAGDPQSGSERYVYREDVLDSFRRANAVQTVGRYEVREAFANYAAELAKEPSVPPEVKARVVERALEMLEQSALQDPDSARRSMYPASLLNRTFAVLQQADPAQAHSWAEKNLQRLRRAELLAPTRSQVFAEEAQTLAYLGRFEEAAAAMKKTISLNPEVQSNYVDLATIYASAGRCDEAATQWQKMKDLSLKPGVADYDRLIGCYTSRRQYAEVIKLYRERLALAPGDAVAMSHLAVIYRDMGDLESARRTALEAAALSPEVAAGLQDFLKTVGKPQ